MAPFQETSVPAGRFMPTPEAAERHMRETKVMQIFERTNRIQRLVISRDLAS
jgi:alkylation response protein AidB-like acyl-CoA dehydrogenase